MNSDNTVKIFDNEIKSSVVKKAEVQKKKFEKQFNHDPEKKYVMTAVKNDVLGPIFGVKNIDETADGDKIDPKKGIIIGTIRMGFGHYRISMAAASAAKAAGYTPYWFNLLGFEDSTATKVIDHMEQQYSKFSRWSQKSKLFNKFVWEWATATLMKRLSYNAMDRKMCELFTNLYESLPKDAPFIATHTWPAQAAVHAGFKNVVNMIPDNWPLALHYSEGAKHAIQTPSAYFGYKTLTGMADNKDEILKSMPANSLFNTGHFIDHEIVSNIDADCKKRLARAKSGERRVLLTIGGAGAQSEVFKAIIKDLYPDIESGKVTLFLNLGDHQRAKQVMWDVFKGKEGLITEHTEWADSNAFVKKAQTEKVNGIHVFLHNDIFPAVYVTNLLMRASDVMLTKPSELAFYPLPKIFIRRVGGHEAWGAIHGAEIGDSTVECETIPRVLQALNLFNKEDDMINMMCDNIQKNNSIGMYDGAYKVIELATGKKIKVKK